MATTRISAKSAPAFLSDCCRGQSCCKPRQRPRSARRMDGWSGKPARARVMVNRLWKHHFGQGIVHSVDNFGKTGNSADPSRIARFPGAAVHQKWLVAVKALDQMMVLSGPYTMSQPAMPEIEKLSSENRLLHRMRCSAWKPNPFRDAILAVAGSLIRILLARAFFPTSGWTWKARVRSLGDGRRNIYIQVRRRFPDAELFWHSIIRCRFLGIREKDGAFDGSLTGTHADE